FTSGAPGEASQEVAPAAMGKQEALRRYAYDLTARARGGAIDPVTARDEEIRQVIDILMRRRQNNPILTGEAGGGKTGGVEGFVSRVAAGGGFPPPQKKEGGTPVFVPLLACGGVKGGGVEPLHRVVTEEENL